MIEPNQLTRPRMSRNGLPHCARAQPVAVLPLNFNLVLVAMFLDHCLVGGLKYRLPWQAQAVTKIANVHPTLARKMRSERRVKPGIYLAHISDGRLAAIAGRCVTEEEDFQRPRLLI